MQGRSRTLLIGGVVTLALALLIVPRIGSPDDATPDTETSNPDTVAPDPDTETPDPDDETSGTVAPFWTVFDDPEDAGRIARQEVLGGRVGQVVDTGTALPLISRSFAALVADFNGDGLDDIQLSRHHNTRFAPADVDGVWLATGSGGYEFAQPLAVFQDRHGCDAADVNGDGALDFFCTMGASRGSVANDQSGAEKVKSNELWINQGDAVFVELGEEWGVADPWGRGREALFFDYDNDGDDDLYVVNSYGRVDDRRSINILYRNDGDRFSEVDSALNGEHGFKCPAVFDWNDDGWEDVLLCNAGKPVFFQNDAGAFSDVTEDILGDRNGWQHAAAGDLDGDGDDDLAVVRKSSVEVWLWNANRGKFKQERNVGFEGQGRWIAVGDFYGDESLDIYAIVNRNQCVDVDASSGNTHDVLVVGPDFEAFARASHGLGCGDRVYPVDGTKLLILNGASKTRGPVEVVDLRLSEAPLVALSADANG